jgi:phage shock protein A
VAVKAALQAQRGDLAAAVVTPQQAAQGTHLPQRHHKVIMAAQAQVGRLFRELAEVEQQE